MGGSPVGYRCVVNGRAGGVEDDAVGQITAGLAASGAETSVAETRSEEELGDVVRSLPEGWALVACGGDGSQHALLQALWDAGRAEVPVGLVPLGTGNDLARGLGLAIDDPAAAAERIVRGTPRALDLLVDDDGAVCVNALHVGVGAQAAARASELKERLDRLAYPVAALLAGVEVSAVGTTVDVDGRRVREESLLMVAVCNGPSLGGGTRMAPDADPGDGTLDVVVVSAVEATARIGFGRALQAGRHLDREDVHHHRGREVTIHMPQARHDVDGEVEEGREGARRWRVHPAAWRLLC